MPFIIQLHPDEAGVRLTQLVKGELGIAVLCEYTPAEGNSPPGFTFSRVPWSHGKGEGPISFSSELEATTWMKFRRLEIEGWLTLTKQEPLSDDTRLKWQVVEVSPFSKLIGTVVEIAEPKAVDVKGS